MTFYYPQQQRKVKAEVLGLSASLWRVTAPGGASWETPLVRPPWLCWGIRNLSAQQGGGSERAFRPEISHSRVSTWDDTAPAPVVTSALEGRWVTRVTPDGLRLGVAPSSSSLIPRASVRWPVFDLRDENAAWSTSCQSESELAFDLEDLCFRFFFFFFSFFLFLCFSFFFLFLCFSLHSEDRGGR